MPPLIPRRRSRRRSVSRRVTVLIVALVLTALLIGGLTQLSRQSGPYASNLNRSFARQGAVVAAASSVTAGQVARLMTTMPTIDRQTLQADLDSVVAQAGEQATRAALLARPAPSGGVGGQFSAVFAERSEAVTDLRAAIDGLLGMHPLAVAGALSGGATVAAAPTLLSSTEASNRIAAAGALLSRSDQEYRALRAALRGSAGHAALPASVWVPDPQLWQAGSVATQVDLVASSSTLAAVHQLVLRTVRLTPQALPPSSGTGTPGVSVLSPTSTVVVSTVISDVGTVDEPRASVQFALTPQPTGITVTQTRTASISAGGSVTLDPVTFGVNPGRSYRLTVSIVLPSAQTSLTGTSLSQVLQIAPSS